MALESLLKERLDLITGSFGMYRRKIDSLIDGIKIMNLSRLVGINKGDLVLYASNHQTFLDYFIPLYAILDNNLPFARVIAGSNLNNYLVRYLMFDFSKWGVIWHDRNNKSIEAMRKYVHDILDTYSQGISVLVFPESRRNRNVKKGDLLDFDENFFRTVLLSEEKTFRKINLVCVACYYDNIPEDGYYEKMDKHLFGSFGYYFWDIYAFQKWKRFERNKGSVRVNFSKPIFISDIGPDEGNKERARRITYETRRTILDLLREFC